MKKLFLLPLAVLLLAFSSMAEDKATLVIKYSFENINEGYDHLTKALFYLDGDLVVEGKEHLQSAPQEISVTVEPGEYDILLEMWTFYEGEWELHSFDNNYSIDCIVDDAYELEPGINTMKVVFDISNGTSYEME